MSQQIPTTPRLTDGRIEGDSYAVTMLVPARYISGMIEKVVSRNVHGTSAADALTSLHLDADRLSRVVAVYPERF